MMATARSPARAAARHGEDSAPVALGDEQRFVAREVDRIDHRVEAGIENVRGGFFIEKLRDDPDFTDWMNGARAIRHGLGFQAADLPVHRMQLAVHIGDTDFIQIDERQLADAGAGERLHRPRANSAHANDRDPRDQETIQRRLTIQPGNAAKAMLEGVGHARNMQGGAAGVTRGMRAECADFRACRWLEPRQDQYSRLSR